MTWLTGYFDSIFYNDLTDLNITDFGGIPLGRGVAFIFPHDLDIVALLEREFLRRADRLKSHVS